MVVVVVGGRALLGTTTAVEASGHPARHYQRERQHQGGSAASVAAPRHRAPLRAGWGHRVSAAECTAWALALASPNVGCWGTTRWPQQDPL